MHRSLFATMRDCLFIKSVQQFSTTMAVPIPLSYNGSPGPPLHFIKKGQAGFG